jgi:hypothetical protein
MGDSCPDLEEPAEASQVVELVHVSDGGQGHWREHRGQMMTSGATGRDSRGHLQAQVHSSHAHNSQKAKCRQWVNEQIMQSIQTMDYYSTFERKDTDTDGNTEEPWSHYPKRNKYSQKGKYCMPSHIRGP